MARTNKAGIYYFSFDVDFFQDEKIQFVSAKYGLKGEIITIRLLCKIYRDGYYTEWNDDVALLFAKSVGDGCNSSLVNDVVNELLKRDFFSKGIFEKYSILTSRGIQKRYFEATKRYKAVEIVQNLLLIDVSKITNVCINPENVYTNPENANINAQTKRKETKRKEKENISLYCEKSKEREKLLEIIFFEKRIKQIIAQFDRFYNHYEARGWNDGSGKKITNKLALLRNWDIKDAAVYPEKFTQNYRKIYDKAKELLTDESPLFLITDFHGYTEKNDAVEMTVSKKLYDFLEKNINIFRQDMKLIIGESNLAYKIK